MYQYHYIFEHCTRVLVLYCNRGKRTTIYSMNSIPDLLGHAHVPLGLIVLISDSFPPRQGPVSIHPERTLVDCTVLCSIPD